jgi:hypothetical protein
MANKNIISNNNNINNINNISNISNSSNSSNSILDMNKTYEWEVVSSSVSSELKTLLTQHKQLINEISELKTIVQQQSQEISKLVGIININNINNINNDINIDMPSFMFTTNRGGGDNRIVGDNRGGGENHDYKRILDEIKQLTAENKQILNESRAKYATDLEINHKLLEGAHKILQENRQLYMQELHSATDNIKTLHKDIHSPYLMPRLYNRVWRDAGVNTANVANFSTIGLLNFCNNTLPKS